MQIILIRCSTIGRMDMQNLDKSKFEQTFAELPAKRMKVLRMLLAGNTDTAIAQSLNIEAGTVRTQIAQICKAFGLSDSSGERRSRRADLLTLFAKYKPELVGEKSKPFDAELKAEATATKVISNSDSDRTGEDSHSPTPHSPRPEDSQARFTLVLSGTVSEVDRARAEAIIAHLKNVVGDVEMTLEEIKSGSILLVCRSSPEDAELVKWMFKSGQLSELLGFPVQDVRLKTASEGAISPNLIPSDSQPEVNKKSTRAISGSDFHSTGEECYSLTPQSTKSENSETKFRLELSGTVSEIDRVRAEAIIDHLKTEITVISGSDSHSTGEESYSPTPQSPKPENSEVKFTLLLSGSVSEIDRARAEAIIAHLKNVVGDVEMTLEAIKSGTVLIVCSSYPEVFELVERKFKSGQLTELYGHDVLNVRLESVSEVAFAPNSINLSQWFQNVFEAGWQTIEEILGTQAPFSLCNTRSVVQDIVERCIGVKLIEFGSSPANYPVALVVSITPEIDGKVNILLRIYSNDEQKYLPPSLQIIVLDELDDLFLEVKSKENDNWIQLEFLGERGDRFSVKVVLENNSITEYFVI